MITDADLAVLIPLWRRTKNIARVWASIRASTPNAVIVFIGSDGDDKMRRGMGEMLEQTGGDAHTYLILLDGAGGGRGDYAHKINAGYEATTQPLLFTGADDLEPEPGWFEAAAALIDIPEEAITVLERDGHSGLLIGPGRVPRVGVVGTNDRCNGRTVEGIHSTHSLVARWYADQGGSVDQDHMIYHEDYWHEYCDDELVETAMRRDAYAHLFDPAVVHNHPLANRAADDETYQRGRARSRESRRVFLRRRRLWRGGQPGTYQRKVLG